MWMRRVRNSLLIASPAFSSAWTLRASSLHFRSIPLRSFVSIAAMPSQSDADKGPSSLRILGVCGGIGSGKSTACKLLVSDLNCAAHIDADSIAHTVYRPGSQAVKDVAAAFGSEIMQSNGEIDRKKLGSIVFANLSDMQKLEQIVWPHVKQDILDQIQTIQNGWAGDGSPVVVVEAAVLLDAGWEDFLNGVLVVTASPRVALDRLMENRGLSEEEAQKRVDAQSSRRGIGNLDEEVQLKVVTAVVQNNGTIENLKEALSQKLEDETTWYRA